MRYAILAVMLFAAACGRTGSSNETANAGASTLEEGLWEATVEILEVKPLAIETSEGSYTPEVVRHSPPTTSRQCLTPQMVAEAYRKFMIGGTASDCDASGFVMADGRISGSLACKSMDEQTTYRLDGRYTATTYDVTTVAEVRARGQQTPMMPTVTPLDMKSRITGQRIGNCASNPVN